ncbi:hypothetical protein LCGC14_1770680 [marine sediment metagenome]|uniref:Uncharacterized protein n=1 Tax=marine sediment metagenome TaxID=412755 RepID=A0A0F9GYD6_9ZZZZ
MIASIKDKEGWMLEKEDEVAERLFQRPFVDLPEKIQAGVRRGVELDYADTLSAYAESRCKDERD